MEKYDLVQFMRRDSYREVYWGRDRRDKSHVLMKFITFDSEMDGVPSSILREVSILKELKHDNVIRLLDTFDTENGFCLVFEYMVVNLSMYINGTSTPELNPLMIKRFLFQILDGLSYCHGQKVIHRDLKPQNLVINDEEGLTIKLSDFGLARTIEAPLPQNTINVAALAYTAPEIVLCTPYSSAVDIWSVGCIFAEMVSKKVLFGGTQHHSAMGHIINVLGAPDEKDWPGVTSACIKLFRTKQMPNFGPGVGLAVRVPGLDTQGLDLLSKMLCFYPTERITAHEAKQHPYFNELRM